MPSDKVKLPRLSLVKNFGAGRLLETVYQQWGAQIVKDLAHPKFQDSGQFIVRGFKLKDATYQELLSRLKELEKNFKKGP